MKYFLTFFLLLTAPLFGQTLTGQRLQLGASTGSGGVLFTQSNGSVTIAGTGNGTDENITVNLNAANVATFSSSTGVATLNFSGFALTTTGVITGVGTGLTGTAAGLTAGAVTTNANLTGHVTSVGNAAVLGSFTLAQLSTAVSDANIARTDSAQTLTGDQTFTGKLLFSADATHDIGASGATRPRDLFLSRNATIGGDLGVTGATNVGTVNTTTFQIGGVTVTPSATELNFVDGVTSAIQTQLDAKITALADPNADRILFWDDSAGAYANLSVGSGLDITGTTITATGGGTATDVFVIAASDETTALTTGTAKVTFRAPYAFTLTGVRISTTTANTGGTLLTVDVNEAGTTLLSTKVTSDASEKTSTTAATPPVISDSSIADDAEITIDIDAVGSTVAGAGLKVYLIHTH